MSNKRLTLSQLRCHKLGLGLVFILAFFSSEKNWDLVGLSVMELAMSAETNFIYAYRGQFPYLNDADNEKRNRSISRDETRFEDWQSEHQVSLSAFIYQSENPYYIPNLSEDADPTQSLWQYRDKFESPDKSDKKFEIFDARLSRDLKVKYNAVFGQRLGVQESTSPSRWTYVRSATGLETTSVEDYNKGQNFGKFMMKYVSEYHFGKLVQTDPRLKPLNEIRKKISHIQVKVKDKYEAHLHYNYTVNNVYFILDNPYKIGNRINIYMDPKQFGPTPIVEKSLTLSYPYSKVTTLSTDIIESTRRVIISGHRRLHDSMSLGVNFSTQLKDRNPEVHDTVGLSFRWDI